MHIRKIVKNCYQIGELFAKLLITRKKIIAKITENPHISSKLLHF